MMNIKNLQKKIVLIVLLVTTCYFNQAETMSSQFLNEKNPKILKDLEKKIATLNGRLDQIHTPAGLEFFEKNNVDTEDVEKHKDSIACCYPGVSKEIDELKKLMEPFGCDPDKIEDFTKRRNARNIVRLVEEMDELNTKLLQINDHFYPQAASASAVVAKKVNDSKKKR